MSVCGACAGERFGPFFRAREWSVSGHYNSVPVKSADPVAIELEACGSCGLIRQVPDQKVTLNYDQIVRGTARQLPVYASCVIASLQDYGVTADDLVVEVGANDGTFLKALRSSGFRNLLGIEPSATLAETSQKAGFAGLLKPYGHRADRLVRSSAVTPWSTFPKSTSSHAVSPISWPRVDWHSLKSPIPTG
jgi:hypothetical protein